MENKTTLRRLSNGTPTYQELADIQTGLMASSICMENTANFIAAHYQPDELQKLREIAAYQRNLAEAIQPDLTLARKQAKEKTTKNAGATVFNGGSSHVRDGSAGKAVSIDDLNRKNREYWKGATK